MQTCAVCSSPLRLAARFCTRCGAPIHAAPVPLEAAVPVRDVAPEPEADPDPEPEADPDPDPQPPLEPDPEPFIPARIPTRGRVTPPLVRSSAATWALVTGIAPLIVSIMGNIVAAQLTVAALARVAQGDPQGAWAPVLVTLTLVFVANAVLLTVCAIAGGRGLRETTNGITRGRGLAVAGLAIGGVNLVLWVAGLVVSISGLDSVLV